MDRSNPSAGSEPLVVAQGPRVLFTTFNYDNELSVPCPDEATDMFPFMVSGHLADLKYKLKVST